MTSRSTFVKQASNPTSLPELGNKSGTNRSTSRGASPYVKPPPASPTQSAPPIIQLQNNPFQKSLFGDVFGTRSLGDSRSMLGILYRARVQESVHMKKKEKSSDESKADTETSLIGSQTSVVDILDSESDSDNDVHKEMNPRLQLATTLRNWSSIESNNEYVIREGGVHALIALAGIDDQAVRKCVASAFFHLSCRKENRRELITLGGATGVITIATQVRSWKLAKLCAWTLCNLSMEEDGQAMAIMAQEGAILALVILLGLRGQRLLPVCVQALYNLTCAENFKGMERILKALINIPQTGFDHSYYLVKALVNCCRFYWMRSRIVEDGALASLVSFVANIHHRENRDECVVLVAICLRQLSESSTSTTIQTSSSNSSSQIRVDMVAKGSIELLSSLMQYCDEKSWCHIVVTLFNLLHIPSQSFPNTPFDTAVTIITDIILKSTVDTTLLTASACMYIITKDTSRMHQRPNIPTRVIVALPKLLCSLTSLSQYFAIASAGFVFFSKVTNTANRMEHLMSKFVEAGPTVVDEKGTHVVALYLAKLSEDPVYMNILSNLNLCLPITDLLLKMVSETKKDMVVQESVCIGVVRIALHLQNMPESLPRKISDMMFDLLCVNDVFVLRNTICGIRCLGEAGLCHNELLSDTFLARVAGIVVRYNDDAILVRNCVAVLAVFSYDEQAHHGLAVDSVLSVLFKAANAEDISTRELVATALCNISVDETVRSQMVNKGVVDVLSNLSGATSELIQELCAKCICNLTASVELHGKIIKNGILQTMLMISLVRAVANTTKQLCARALLNLLEDKNIDELKAAGAVRVFATLSSIDNLPIQNICARAFLIFTGTESKREDIISRRAVLHSIYGMVKCSSLRVNVMVGLAICNLLVCPTCQKAAIHAGGLSVLKIIASMDIDELTEATARVIVNLILEPSLHHTLLREPLVPVLVLFLQHPSRTAFECALHALSCMCQYEIFHNLLIDKGCVTALVGALIAGRINSHTLGVEVCRCLCLLSFNQKRTEAMIVHGNIMIAPHIIYRNGTCTAHAATMIAMLFRNLSFDRAMYKQILDQDVLRLLKCLYTDFRSECAGVCRAAIIFMNNIAHDSSLHEALLKQGLMSMLLAVVTTAVEHGKKHFNLAAKKHQQHHGAAATLSPSYSHVHHSDSNKRAASPNGSNLNHELSGRDRLLSINMRTGSPHMGGKQNADDYLDDNNEAAEDRFDPFHSKYLILTKKDVYFMARTLNLVASSALCHQQIVDGNAVLICDHLLADDAVSHSRHEVASALCALSSSKSCRKTLVDQGAAELLVMLARSASSRETQMQCSLALGYLSEITHVSKDVVGTLLLLNLKHEEMQEALEQQEHEGGEKDKLGFDSHGKRSGSSASQSPGGRYNLMGEQLLLQQEQQGPKSLKVMIRDGLLHKKDIHTVSIEADRRKSATLENLTLVEHGLPELGSQPELKMTPIEAKLLQGHYNVFKFQTITLTSIPQAAGMAARASLESLYMQEPALSTERNLEPPDRLEELRSIIKTWTYIKDPLSKECGALAEYIGPDDQNQIAEADADQDKGLRRQKTGSESSMTKGKSSHTKGGLRSAASKAKESGAKKKLGSSASTNNLNGAAGVNSGAVSARTHTPELPSGQTTSAAHHFPSGDHHNSNNHSSLPHLSNTGTISPAGGVSSGGSHSPAHGHSSHIPSPGHRN